MARKDTPNQAIRSRIIDHTTEDPADLLANPLNFRRHPGQQLDALRGSMKELGWLKAVLVNKTTGHVIDGHARCEEAMRQGVKVPVDWVELTEAEERLALAVLDPITEMATRDIAILADLLAEVSTEDPGLQALLDELAGKEPEVAPKSGLKAGADPDAVPEPPKVPVTKPGDLYILGAHRLLCGDSTNRDHVGRLMDGAKADMVFTDPPYGVNFQSNMSKRFDVLKNDDRVLDVAPVIFETMGEDTAAIVWTSQQVYPAWRSQFESFYKSTVIWSKGGDGMGDLAGDFAPNYEMALFCVKGRPTFQAPRPGAVWDVAKDRAVDYVHPTQKPVALAEHGLNLLCKPGGVVLDLFGGSGTTLIACETTGRTARMMELDPIYCDVIVKRWEEATGKKAELVPHA